MVIMPASTWVMQCYNTEVSNKLKPVSREGEVKVNSICMETQYKTSTCRICLLFNSCWDHFTRQLFPDQGQHIFFIPRGRSFHLRSRISYFDKGTWKSVLCVNSAKRTRFGFSSFLAMLAGFQRARNSLFVWKSQIPIKLSYCTNAMKIKNTTACLLFTYNPSTKNVWELKIMFVTSSFVGDIPACLRKFA